MAAEAEAVVRVEETTVKPWVIAAPRHGLRRDHHHRDGLRHSHARVHGQTLALYSRPQTKIPKVAVVAPSRDGSEEMCSQGGACSNEDAK